MFHPLQHITDLSELCHQAGFANIVISPGSRNAPLIDTFVSRFGDRCYSLVDERSAAYFALGLARESRKPVVLVCTSGTAVLNYAPAIAEAYYQQIPLLVITADRPAEWVDQLDNQTIRQVNVYQNYSKSGHVLPERITDAKLLLMAHDVIGKALQEVGVAPFGPVHLNVPLHEPLYDKLPLKSKNLPLPAQDNTQNEKSELPTAFRTAWENAKNILIIHGQDLPEKEDESLLAKLGQDSRVVLLAENIANRQLEDRISQPDLFFAQVKTSDLPLPDLMLYAGGQLVSKRIKIYLRSLSIPTVWRVGKDHFEMDTFRQQNDILPLPAEVVYERLAGMLESSLPNSFKKAWLEAFEDVKSENKTGLASIAYSDVSVMRDIHNDALAGSRMELGNSSSIRYSQLIPLRDDLVYYSNRGVSGIDGCLSAAVGTASSTEELCYTILGDLSFVYDSNALWNRSLPQNLRIVVLNNRGGGIFDLIDGPGKKAAYEEFFLAHHPVDLQKLAEAFNLSYFCVKDRDELLAILPELKKEQDTAVIVEVLTDREQNTAAFKNLMNKGQINRK